MRKYQTIHRELWALLLATGAVKSTELEKFGINQKHAEWLVNWVVELIEEEAENTGDPIVDISFTLDSRSIIGKLTPDPRDTILR